MNIDFEEAKVFVSDLVSQNLSEFGNRFNDLNIAKLVPSKSIDSDVYSELVHQLAR